MKKGDVVIYMGMRCEYQRTTTEAAILRDGRVSVLVHHLIVIDEDKGRCKGALLYAPLKEVQPVNEAAA